MKNAITALCMLLLLLSCRKDRDDFLGYSDEKIVKKYFLRGNGEWNIDEIKVWIVDPGSGQVYADITHTDVGYFKFKSAGKLDWIFTNDVLDLGYLKMYSRYDSDWNYLGGDFDIDKEHGHVLTVDKKKMILFSPSSLNLYTTSNIISGKYVEFQLKLSKK